MKFTKIVNFGLILALSVASAGATCTPVQKLFGGCPSTAKTSAVPAAPVAFVPTFETVGMYNDYYPTPRPVNSRYFATEATALAIMEKFGASKLEYEPALANQGARYVYLDGPEAGKPAVYRYLVFTVGTFLRDSHGTAVGSVEAEFKVNAGVLADEYVRNPESEHPAQDYVYGYPPVTGHYLSNAEQGVWSTLNKLAAAAKAQVDAAAQK